jgi:hypothetical protein
MPAFCRKARDKHSLCGFISARQKIAQKKTCIPLPSLLSFLQDPIGVFRINNAETFGEYSILPKYKEGDNFKRRNTLKYFEYWNLSLTQ